MIDTIMKALNGESLKLNLREKLLLKYFCYPPPGRDEDPEEVTLSNSEPLELFFREFGADFQESIEGKTTLDVGGGLGAQVLGLAEAGSSKAIGAEYRPIFEAAMQYAERLGISDRIAFTLSPIRQLDEGSVDIAISQNSFEHFNNPEIILSDVFHVLRPDGKFFITFSPPWLHPFGVHMFFMLKYPWTHFIFSEKTILTVRKLYREDGAERFEDTDGGLNQMTISKFERLVRESGFHLERLILTPIRVFPRPLIKLPVIREFITSTVSAVLVKPNSL